MFCNDGDAFIDNEKNEFLGLLNMTLLHYPGNFSIPLQKIQIYAFLGQIL